MNTKKKILTGAVIVVVLAGAGYQAYLDYQMQKTLQTDQAALSFLASPDSTGVTGFDKMVVQTINKINQAQQAQAQQSSGKTSPAAPATPAPAPTPAKK